MQRTHTNEIRTVLTDVRKRLGTTELAGCDVEDVEEVISRAEQELDTAHPNPLSLGTWLNSVARSLRSFPATRATCLRLDKAMRNAGIATDWEH